MPILPGQKSRQTRALTTSGWVQLKYSDDQARDEGGRWTSGGAESIQSGEPSAIPDHGGGGLPAVRPFVQGADTFAAPTRPAKSVDAGFKARYWKRVDGQARSHEGRALGAAAAAFEHDKRELLAMVGETGKAARRSKATVDWQGLLLKAKDYLALGGPADTNWREVFTPVLAAIMADSGETMLAEFDMQFAVPNIGGLQWFQDYTLKFAQPINETTLNSISTLLQQATDEGWSVGTMQSHLQEVFAQWAGGGADPDDFNWYTDRMPWYRAEMIARTETIRASNAGSEGLMRDWGIEKKEWLATDDERVRDDHWEATGQVVGIDEPFDVGGEDLMFPGDPAGSPGNTINCRCTVLPIVPGFTGGPETPEDVLGEEAPPPEEASSDIYIAAEAKSIIRRKPRDGRGPFGVLGL